jgi:hypothetical protein
MNELHVINLKLINTHLDVADEHTNTVRRAEIKRSATSETFFATVAPTCSCHRYYVPRTGPEARRLIRDKFISGVRDTKTLLPIN